MLLSSAQLDEFKAEGVLPIPGLIPPYVLDGWQDQMRAACSGGVNLDDPSTWPAGRYAPEGGWPELSPNLYDLPGLQSIVEQIGGGAFAPSHPAGQPWTPQIPMTRVILPSATDTEWAPPSDGHPGYATGWGGGVLRRAALGCQQPYGRRHGLLAKVAPSEPPILPRTSRAIRRLVPLHRARAERRAPGDLGG